MNVKTKAFFVDGPMHGHIMLLEGEPRENYVCAGQLIMEWKPDVTIEFPEEMLLLKHRYRLCYKHKEQYIYAHEGVARG